MTLFRNLRMGPKDPWPSLKAFPLEFIYAIKGKIMKISIIPEISSAQLQTFTKSASTRKKELI